MRNRSAAVSGSFYPSEPESLRRLVSSYLQHDGVDSEIQALVCPHAGYIYSGAVAGCAYSLLRTQTKRIKRVVILGPSHTTAFHGFALPKTDGFSTPLGTVPVDSEMVDTLASLNGVQRNDAIHENEHAIETQLPFLQVLLNDFLLTPISVGKASLNDTVSLIEKAKQHPGTLVIVSTDLSHYLTYAQACEKDQRTARAILEGQASHITADCACGYYPLLGLIAFASANHWQAKLLALQNSGDTAGSKSRVVGYAAISFSAAAGQI